MPFEHFALIERARGAMYFVAFYMLLLLKSLRLRYVTPLMSPGWRYARASSFTSLRDIPQAQ
jgi:hypothetical protein